MCVCVCFKIGVILNIHKTLLIGKCNCWVEKCYICRCLVVTFCGNYSFQACIIEVSWTCLLQKTNSRLPSKNGKLWCQLFYRLVYNCQIDSVIIKNLNCCWFSLELHTQLLFKNKHVWSFLSPKPIWGIFSLSSSQLDNWIARQGLSSPPNLSRTFTLKQMNIVPSGIRQRKGGIWKP